MILIPKKLICKKCLNNYRVKQDDGTEKTENLVCDKYEDGIPRLIILGESDCSFFDKIDT